MKALVAAAVLLLASTSLGAESAHDVESAAADTSRRAGPMFRAATEIVALNVTASDARDEHVPGLTASDFVVLEDGVEQSVAFFAVSEVPVDLTLLVDASASMFGKIDIARQAVRGLLHQLRPDDRVSIVEFRDRMVQYSDLTGDREALAHALDRIRPQGDTALYNALYVALSQAPQPGATAGGAPRRQALVVLSDGEDTSSLIGFEEVLERARRSGTTIYTIALRHPEARIPVRAPVGGARSYSEGDYALRTLARETGGRSFFPAGVEELPPIYAGIGTELGQQYSLGYVPHNAARDGGWRRVQVQVPTRPAVRLRTRAGYYAEAGAGRIAAAARHETSSR